MQAGGALIQADGGLSGGAMTQAPTSSKGAVWGPVLHCDDTGMLWLFYSESTECIKPVTPPSWEPGGDIKVITTRDPEGGKWSEARILLRQSSDGIPKVIANKLVVLSSGEW
jgi:hypothetical protein